MNCECTFDHTRGAYTLLCKSHISKVVRGDDGELTLSGRPVHHTCLGFPGLRHLDKSGAVVGGVVVVLVGSVLG